MRDIPYILKCSWEKCADNTFRCMDDWLLEVAKAADAAGYRLPEDFDCSPTMLAARAEIVKYLKREDYDYTNAQCLAFLARGKAYCFGWLDRIERSAHKEAA